MSEGPVTEVCPAHQLPFAPFGPGQMACPAGCVTDAPPLFPVSPMSSLEVGAAQRHELVVAHEKAGFSRPEAMQVLCTFITATVMKGSGGG
jgi:hypothetical protein